MECRNIGCKKSFRVHTLPDIEMYGGDTIPWEVTLVEDDGTKLLFDSASKYTATLTFTPLKTTTGLGSEAVLIPPILTKTGTVEPTHDGGSVVVFVFDEEDTKGLRGKFIYQIEIARDEDLRLCQGSLYIKQNINR